ncbi:MAG: hypothetical protein JHC22_00125 [Thermoproteus sp.]|nr:hypothetical protein [Thermoproteus sp.]
MICVKTTGKIYTTQAGVYMYIHTKGLPEELRTMLNRLDKKTVEFVVLCP